ncbi:MAG: UDP-3-O-acyl-N-acetylglucosamine deacetylase [Phycisphaeraceae bacterium]
MRFPRKTIARPARLEGVGLFSSTPVRLTFCPDAAGAGVRFVRVDASQTLISARVEYAIDQPRRTTLAVDGVMVETVEHVLSAVVGLGITDLRIEMDAPEVPALDGSAAGFVEALVQAGVTGLEGEVEPLVIRERVRLEGGGGEVVCEPEDQAGTVFSYELDYRPHPFLGRSVASYQAGVEDYATEVAPARTFVLEEEAKALRDQGLGKHLTPESLLVVGDSGPLGPNRLRFEDEPARHKLLDLIGDLSLVGRPLVGRITARKSGHALNRAMAVKLLEIYG